MFFCCPGGGRKVKTKEDLVDAATGFGAGAPAGRTASHRGQDGVSANSSTANSVDRAHMGLAGRMVAPVHTPVNAPGHASGQDTPPGYHSRPITAPARSPPPRPHQERVSSVNEDRGRPTSSEEGLEVATAAPAPDHIAPLPNSVFTTRKRPSNWLSRDRNLGSIDDEDVTRRTLAYLAGWPVGEELDAVERHEGLEDEYSERPGWLNPTESVMEKESVRPGWIEKTNSVADTETVKRVWIDAPESVDEDVRRPHWLERNGGETPQSVRPGWIDQSGSVIALSARPEVRDDDESVIARSVRPGWIGQSGPEISPSVRRDVRDDDESVMAPSVRPGWMGQSGPEFSPSVRPDVRYDDHSVLAPSVRPGWIDQQGSEISSSVRPDGRGDEALGFGGPQQQPFWTARAKSEEGESVRPGWMEGAVRTVGGIYRINDEDGRSVRPGWMAADEDSPAMTGPVLHPPGQVAPSPRPHDGQTARPSNLRPTPVKIGRDAHSGLKGPPEEGSLSPTSPVGTIAGQCTSQDAARHKSELQDPPEGQSRQSKPATAEKGPQSDAGRLQQLLDSTDKREAERRRFEKEKSDQRRFASLADPRDRIEVEEVLRQQPPQQRPQQDSAEEPTKIVKIRRSGTMPAVPDGSLTTPTVTGMTRNHRGDRDKRPPTPSAIPPHRTSHSLAHGSNGFKHMSPSTTPGRAIDRGSPHTPMTVDNSFAGSSPSPSVPLHVTNPYGGSSPNPAVISPGPAVPGGAKGPRGGAKLDHRGRSPSPVITKVMAPSSGSKGRTPSPGMSGTKMAAATARKPPYKSPVVMVSATSPATVRNCPRVMVRGDVHGVSGSAAGVKEAQGTPTTPGDDGCRRGGREGAAVVRFTGVGSSSSEERAPGAITEVTSETPASPAVTIATSPSDKAQDVPSRRRGSNGNGYNNSSGSGSKPKNSAGVSLSSRMLPFSKEGRARMSSGSSSASSGDGRKTGDGTPRRDREQATPRKKKTDSVGTVKKPKSSRPRSPEEITRVEQATGPPPSGGALKMWSGDSTAREAAAPVTVPGGKGPKGLLSMLGSQSRPVQADRSSRGRTQGTVEAGGVGAGQANPKVEVISLIKTPQLWTARGRQSRPQLGTPAPRNLARLRGRTPSLASVNEEPINASPAKTLDGQRRNSTGSDSTSGDTDDAIGSRFVNDFEARDDKPDLGQRPAVFKPGKEPQHVAPTYFAPLAGVKNNRPPVTTPAVSTARSGELQGATPQTPHDLPKGLSGKFGETAASSADEKAEVGVKWLEGRKRPAFLDASLRRSQQRMSRSSSMDDGSGGSFCPRVMFSPDRFNAFAGALSRGGSVDDSLCDSSVRSFMTTGTRNSSSTSLVSARGLSDRKLIAPQLSKSERQTVARLKIKRGDVHFGYHTVRGSARVYKAELNGEVCAAKVLDILGMSKEAQADVFETFDAELFALSRLNTTNIVKVHGASVSSAEILIVSEFVEGGVLRQLLDNRSKQRILNDRMRLVIAMDVAAGMKSLYAHGMQHRKLTSSAILLTGDYRAKIVGVGLSMTTEMIAFFLGKEGDAEEQEEEGLPWASREVLAGAGFSEKSDVYSFGIVLWELMQTDGSMPYAGLTSSEVVGAKYNGEGPAISPHCDPAIRNLMESCWSNLPADRPSFDKICDILEAISLDRGDQKKSAPTSRMAGGSSGTFAGAMSVP